MSSGIKHVFLALNTALSSCTIILVLAIIVVIIVQHASWIRSHFSWCLITNLYFLYEKSYVKVDVTAKQEPKEKKTTKNREKKKEIEHSDSDCVYMGESTKPTKKAKDNSMTAAKEAEVRRKLKKKLEHKTS